MVYMASRGSVEAALQFSEKSEVIFFYLIIYKNSRNLSLLNIFRILG